MAKVEIDPTEFDLDDQCWDCNPGTPCGFCGGSGYVTTEFGEMVLNFIARHWNVIQDKVAATRKD